MFVSRNSTLPSRAYPACFWQCFGRPVLILSPKIKKWVSDGSQILMSLSVSLVQEVKAAHARREGQFICRILA